MAHMIALDKMYGGVRKAAWHGLGQTWDDQPTPVEALQRIDADYEIHKIPLTVTLGEHSIQTDQYALVREAHAGWTEPAYLGTVGANYEVVQNRDIANLLTPLADKWPVETVAVLGDGGHMLMSLKAGTWDVKGEELTEYFLMSNRSDGSGALTLSYTPVRVVCMNTLVAAISKASVSVALPHSQRSKLDVEYSVNLLKRLQDTQSAGRSEFLRLTEIILKPGMVNELIPAILPLPAMPSRLALVEAQGLQDASDAFIEMVTLQKAHHRQATERVESKRQAVAEMYGRFNDEFPATAGTGWALYNAVVEEADHRRGDPEKAGLSALFGSRALQKQRAFEVIMARA